MSELAACEQCLLHSALRSETLQLHERDQFGRREAAEILRLDPADMRDAMTALHPGINEIIRRQTHGLLEEAARDHGIWTICVHDPEYPGRLTRLTDPPPVIYGIGSKDRFDELGSDGIAVVGSRRASAYGREVAYSIGNEASSVGLTVVSGMALGIDGAAHRGALQGGGRTIAVLAGSPELAYPRSHRLLHEQIVSVGCVVSESPPGTEAKRWAFVARNRIIAGLARMTIFVEGGENSGALHTVKFAEQMDAIVGAVPGPVTSPVSVGPNELLSGGGAALVRGIEDVSALLKLEHAGEMQFEFVDMGEVDQAVLDLISTGERTPRAIAAELDGASPREISQALGRLELAGRLTRLPGGEYVRTR